MDIIFENVGHIYQENTPFEYRALYEMNLQIDSSKFFAIIGHTGSGKSTLIQFLNGLLKPTSGIVKVGDQHQISGEKKSKNLKSLRKKVGMVFQFPEHQLFEETVEKDICFGPMNFGLSLEVAKERARKSLEMVGLPLDVLTLSPFDLSGGQKRRVAIAGVLAMEPEVLVLDEPTAGLDPQGQQDMMNMFKRLHHEKQLTTVLVTHNMNDAAIYADEIMVINKGEIFKKGSPKEIFSDPVKLQEIGIDIPDTVNFMMLLEKKFGITLSYDCFTIEDAVKQVEQIFLKKNKGEL